MMACNRHSSAVTLETLHRDTLVNAVVVGGVFVIVYDFDFARELDVIVLYRVSILLGQRSCSRKEKKRRNIKEDTYSKLANLYVINAKGFLFFGGTQAKYRNVSAEEVEGTKNQTGAEERVCAAAERICKLVTKLNPVLV